MKRKQIRMLNPLKKSNIKIKELFGFDIETIPKKDNEFLMGSIVGEDYKFISWNKDKLKKKILSYIFKNKVMVATNLGFDICSIFSVKELLDKDKFDFLLQNKGSGFIYIRYIPYNILFIDTFNFYPVSVKTLGEKLGLPKFKFPKIINEINNISDIKHPDYVKQIEEYNLRDSEISYKWLSWFQDITNKMGGNMKKTIASSALDLFKRKYLNGPIAQPKKELLLHMYSGYYGGRTETFFKGLYNLDNFSDKLNYYDINSCYVSVMRKEFPDINTIKFKSKGNLTLIDLYNGMSKIKLKSPDTNIPYIPHKFGIEKQKKLLFPIGNFEGWYNHFEIKKALDMGYEILDIGKCIYFTDIEYYLLDYAEEMYNERMEDTINQLMYKLYGNSLYGKFGQRFDMENKIIYNIDDYDFDTKEHIELEKKGKVFFNDFYVYVNEKNNFYGTFIMPIISLYTTSYARNLLYDSFVKNNENNIMYMDTDSGITTKKIKISKDLGGIKKEHDITKMILVKPKNYFIENNKGKNIFRFKGIPNKFFIENPKLFSKILDEKQFKFDRFVKFKEGLRRNLKPNSIIKNYTKKFNFEDNKRKWNKPFSLDYFIGSEPIKIKNE